MGRDRLELLTLNPVKRKNDLPSQSCTGGAVSVVSEVSFGQSPLP